jgi:hypothetical protein
MEWGKLVDADKLGGWVRAGAASLLATVVAKNPTLSAYLDPVTQAAIATALSGVAVGAWSQLTKTDAAKVQMAAEVPSVTKILTTDPTLNNAVTAPEVQLSK